jgi:hypothetical protein
MENTLMIETWNKIKKQYLIGVFISIFLVGFSYFMAPSYKLSDLTKMTLKLSRDPVWNVKHHKGKWVDLYFSNDSKKYTIFGIDYLYLNYPVFKDSIKKGDIVKIGLYGNNIFTFDKNGVQYLKFKKAQFHKTQNRLFGRRIFYTGLICCLIPLFFNRYPMIKMNGREIPIRFDWILIFSLIIAFLTLGYSIGFQYVSRKIFQK